MSDLMNIIDLVGTCILCICVSNILCVSYICHTWIKVTKIKEELQNEKR
jgi:hypothetical protein